MPELRNALILVERRKTLGKLSSKEPENRNIFLETVTENRNPLL